MAGYRIKKFNTVVMDGSDEKVVKEIKEIIDMVVDDRFDRSTCRPLDKQHPTMIVIETVTTENRYDNVEGVIEGLYPGLCTFNPAI